MPYYALCRPRLQNKIQDSVKHAGSGLSVLKIARGTDPLCAPSATGLGMGGVVSATFNQSCTPPRPGETLTLQILAAASRMPSIPFPPYDIRG